jgi:hypothetical protein
MDQISYSRRKRAALQKILGAAAVDTSGAITANDDRALELLLLELLAEAFTDSRSPLAAWACERQAKELA